MREERARERIKAKPPQNPPKIRLHRIQRASLSPSPTLPVPHSPRPPADHSPTPQPKQAWIPRRASVRVQNRDNPDGKWVDENAQEKKMEQKLKREKQRINDEVAARTG